MWSCAFQLLGTPCMVSPKHVLLCKAECWLCVGLLHWIAVIEKRGMSLCTYPCINWRYGKRCWLYMNINLTIECIVYLNSFIEKKFCMNKRNIYCIDMKINSALHILNVLNRHFYPLHEYVFWMINFVN